MLLADNWCVKVDERIYGPYSSQQLRKFAHEGRLAAWSRVAPAGSRSWREAREEPTFAAFFGLERARPASHSAPTFGKRSDADSETQENEETETPAAKKSTARTFDAAIRLHTDHHVAPEPGPTNFIIIFDVVSAAASRIETAILSLGPGFQIADNVWTVNCEMTALGVRNALAPYLLPREPIFVIAATRGHTSWQNFTPTTHAKLAAAWAATKA